MMTNYDDQKEILQIFKAMEVMSERVIIYLIGLC